MKKLTLILLLSTLSSFMFAQVPQKMSYQCVVRDNSGNLIVSHAIGIQISILQGSSSGTTVFVERHSTTTNINGLATIEIGGGTQISSNNFSSVNWGSGSYFIKTETDPAGGTNYTISGTSQLLSVPYALYAVSSGSVSQGSGCFTHYIGEFYGGGIIAHVWRGAGNVEHVLIVSTENLSDSISWSSPDSAITTGPGTFDPVNGQANTAAIINFPNYTYSAAKLCTAYNGGGYNDWYLPAIWELEKVFLAGFELNLALTNDGNSATIPFDLMGSPYYWSSTEGDMPA